MAKASLSKEDMQFWANKLALEVPQIDLAGELSRLEAEMTEEEYEPSEIIEAKQVKTAELYSPQICVEIRVKLPGHPNFRTVVPEAQIFMSEEELFGILNAAARFQEHVACNRIEQLAKLQEVRGPEAVIESSKRLVSLTERKTKALFRICSHQENPFFRKLKTVGGMIFWRQPDSLQIMKEERRKKALSKQ